MDKFEQLIKYSNNGEDALLNELFHEIVVEKSREIYESLMDSENEMGGDSADELLNDITSDENGMREDDDLNMEPELGADDELNMEPEVDADEFGGEEGEADLEDRVVDLEDQLDALMAEFDSVIGGEEAELGSDELGAEAGEEFGAEAGEKFGAEEENMEGRFNEAVSLTKVTTGIANSTEPEGTNKRSINADNSGKKGAVAKPHQTNGEEGNVANPTVKPGDGTTAPNESKVKEPKKKGEDGAINKKSLSGS